RNVLIRQHIEDVPKIVSRICGICPIVHRIGALKAIEVAFEITPPPIAKIVREIAILGEIIRSHTYSTFFSTLPDLMYLANQVSRKDIIGVDKTQSRALPVATQLYRTAETLISSTAGHTNMGYNLILGGIRSNITIDQQQTLIQSLHAILPGIQWIKEFYRWLLNEVEGEIQHFTLSLPLFISAFDTTKNRFSGINEVSLHSADEHLYTFSSDEFPQQINEYTQIEAPTGIAYSSIKYPKLRLLAGPHARLASLHGKSTKNKNFRIGIPNLFYAGLLRLDEIEFSITNALHLLEAEWTTHEDITAEWHSQPSAGSSAVEAPRGTLLYHLKIDSHQKIKDIQILVPTELNVLALTEITRNIVSACLELGWTLDQTMERAQMGIRCFDPCVSCATHTDVRYRG
ncbi:MAG: nickel-dependent hydrogenase large subunit, partial [Candidatus Thorarchaeota archaeon]